MKMRYSIEPRDRIYVKGYGLLSFAKNMGKSLSYKYGQKLLDSARKSTIDAIKTTLKRAIQKAAEATGDLISNKIADKITGVSMELNSKKKFNYINDNDNNNINNNINNNNNNDDDDNLELTTHKKRYISPQERQQIINELRLVPKQDSYF